jgi:hypothetical protein
MDYAADMDLNKFAKDWLMKRHSSEDVLQHEAYGQTKITYSSPYYDYQKAHDYYEAHKQLKGRKRSTSLLSDEGKEIWQVSQYNIKQAKEKENTSMSEQLKGQVSSIQSAIAQMKVLAAGQRGSQKLAIQARITELRAVLAKKKEALKSELKKKQEGIKTDNTRATEQNRKRNESLSEKAKQDKERNAQNAATKIERKQAEIKKLGSSQGDQKKKEALRKDIANIRADKSNKNARVSSNLSVEKASNSADLRDYKAKNSQDLTNYRATNSSQVKQASESINSSIKGLRQQLSDYNTKNRAMVKEDSDTMRNAIKQLREVNRQNRQILKDKYEGILDSEFDKIASAYPKKGKR